MEITDATEEAGDTQHPQQQLDGDGDALDEQLTDSSRIWSADVLLELVHIWRRVELAHPALGRVAKAQLVYDEFSEKVDRGGGSNGNEGAVVVGGGSGGGTVTKRSRKAVEDKLYTMKQMYRFIIDMNRDFGRQRNARSGMRSWFDLSKQERRAVRSLHGIRIPNISHEVFQVLDSVLHADAAATKPRKKVKTRQSIDAIGFQPPPTSLSTHDGSGGDDADDIDEEGASHQAFVLDSKRNWSADATMQLANIWGDIQHAYPSLRGTLLGDQVYSVFKAKAGGSLSRSQKAVEEKMQSMKEMYRFIKSYEDAREAIESDGNTGGLEMKPSWFELTKAEKRQLRKANKIRVTNLSREQFDQVDAIMSVRAEAEATLLEITRQQPPLPPGAPPSPTPSVQPQQQQQTVHLASNAINGRKSNTSTQSSGVLEVMQHVIAQELRTDSLVEQQRVGTQGTLTAAMRTQKRLRADGAISASCLAQAPVQTAFRAGSIGIDDATAEYLLKKIRILHEQDCAERRRQHEEHMTAIRELADMLKNQQDQQPPSNAVAREAAASEGV